MRELGELLNSDNLPFVESLYQRFRDDPDSVDAAWRPLFERLRADDAAGSSGGSVDTGNASELSFGSPFAATSLFNPPGAAPTAQTAPAAQLAQPRRREPITGDLLPSLHSLDLFHDLPDDEIRQLLEHARELEYASGDLLFRQGDASEALFVVLDGSVVITVDGRVRAELGVGMMVGELGVLQQQPRIANAVCRGTTRLLRLPGKVLMARLNERPALARGLLRGLSTRIRDIDRKQDRVDQLIRVYRVRGHLLAHLDPLSPPPERNTIPELRLEEWDLSEDDLDTVFSSTTIPGTTFLTLREIRERLEASYCKSIAVQYMHIDDPAPKRWLQERLEDPEQRRKLSRDEQLRILTKLTDAQIFEEFIHNKFRGAKRFSAEGAETLIPLLDQALDEAGEHGVEEVVIGMAHRGRLNVMANILGKSAARIFREFEDVDPEKYLGRGDVKYHLGYSSDRTTSNDKQLHLSLCFNPSHLEFVGPVVLGRVRAKQDRRGDGARRERVMGLVIHGDAAFAGQGVVQEMLNMSKLPGFRTGGTLHIIVNNQVGFTTPPESGRSCHYATDVAKMLQTPVFHVNGEHPEAVAQVLRIAMDYRRTFDSDVIIDMYCYRRYGHNEGDEPWFTQPQMYDKIAQRKSVREGYLDSLLQLGEVSAEEADSIEKERHELLDKALDEARRDDYEHTDVDFGGGVWTPYKGDIDHEVEDVDTGVDAERLSALLRAQTEVPEGFEVHKTLRRILLQARRDMAAGARPLDWAAGEALAFATLLTEGKQVRLSGQDAGRGTFSHRHAVLHDQKDGGLYLPLQYLHEHLDDVSSPPGRFEVWDSPLSEVGPTGFEYGYSLDFPDGLTLWEAQFGDFVNVAQVIIDQFISSSEDKWHRLNSLAMLLPHGFEGQGPEHSSARLERFLNLCAEDNLQVVNLTTPAQLFHCLRRQVHRPLRKPLIVMSPKSLLRHKEAISSLDELANGRFQRILPDTTGLDPKKVERVLLCSGKVYYDLTAARTERGLDDTAILRLEQYYPLRPGELRQVLDVYPESKPVVWVQEEPENMGAWRFLQAHLTGGASGGGALGKRQLQGIYRPASASPATGSKAAHDKEQKELIDAALRAA